MKIEDELSPQTEISKSSIDTQTLNVMFTDELLTNSEKENQLRSNFYMRVTAEDNSDGTIEMGEQTTQLDN